VNEEYDAGFVTGMRSGIEIALAYLRSRLIAAEKRIDTYTAAHLPVAPAEAVCDELRAGIGALETALRAGAR